MAHVASARRSVDARLKRVAGQLRPEPADVLMWVVRNRFVVGIGIFALASILTLDDAVRQQGQAWALLALLAVPAAYVLRGRQRMAALALVAGGIVLRVAVAGVWEADPVAVTAAAGRAALDGYNPYGHGYGAAVPPGAPFPYGPLALIWGLPGQIVESAASVATMLLFVLTGSWIVLGLYAADNFTVHSATQGVNDLSPGLLIAIAFLLMRRRPVLGGVVLAAAAAIKPYAFAWFPAAVGYAGLPALIGLAGASAVLWSPLLEWGIGSYVKSVAMARAIHPSPNALNLPELRVLGIPLAIASLWARRWEVAIAAGTVVFTVVLFFDHWASKGYWLAVMPILGIAAEGWVVRRAPMLARMLRRVPGEQVGHAPAPATEGATAPMGGGSSSLAAQPIGADQSELSPSHQDSAPDGWSQGP